MLLNYHLDLYSRLEQLRRVDKALYEIQKDVAADRWSRRERVQAEPNHTGKVDGELSYSMKSLSTEELKRLVQLDDE